MNLDGIKAVATSKIARQALLARKFSPQVLFVAGTVGVIGATVLACRATLKMDSVLETHDKNQANIDSTHSVLDEGTHETHRKESVKLKLQTAAEIAKLYAPAVLVGTASIAALTGSHVILSKRNTAVMAAYAGIDRAYREYRKRVSDEYGEDVDRKFSIGAEDILVEEKTANGGTKTRKTTVVKKGGKLHGSPYAALFDDKSKHFTREPGMNAIIISVKQSHMNDKLKANGHLFLNEVYDCLDLPRTKEGALVGWVYDPRNEDHVGDNYVTFNIFENEPNLVEEFMDGNNPVWLDFNVDGVIYNLI
jgi:hypothetical protein